MAAIDDGQWHRGNSSRPLRSRSAAARCCRGNRSGPSGPMSSMVRSARKPSFPAEDPNEVRERHPPPRCCQYKPDPAAGAKNIAGGVPGAV